MKKEIYIRKIKSTNVYKNAVKARERRDLIDNYIEKLLTITKTSPDILQNEMFNIAYVKLDEAVLDISDVIIKYLEDSKIRFNENWEEECLNELRKVSKNAFDNIDKEISNALDVVMEPILDRFYDDRFLDSVETYFHFNKIAATYLNLLKTEESFRSQLNDCIHIMLSSANDYFTSIKECIESKEKMSVKKNINEENKLCLDESTYIQDINIQIGEKTYKHRTYKELNKIAEDLNFKVVRCTGDHAIYSRQNSSIVIIPQGRDIGKGLQLKILKNLRA